MIEIDTIVVTGGFEIRQLPWDFTARSTTPRLSPGGFTRVNLTFVAPDHEAAVLGRLRLFPADPLAPVPEVLLTADVVRAPPAPPMPAARIAAREWGTHRRTPDDLLEFPLLFELPPTPPGAAGNRLRLRLIGDVPPAGTADVAAHELVTGPRRLIDAWVRVPEAYIHGRYGVRLEAISVLTRERSTVSEPVPLPDSPPPPRCSCDGAGSETVVLVEEEHPVPNPHPMERRRPSQDPVASVEVRISGPPPGGCCDVESGFEVDVSLDSRTSTGNDRLSAFLLWSGLCERHGVSWSTSSNERPGSPRAELPGAVECGRPPPSMAALGRVRLVASSRTPLRCEPDGAAGWSCGIRRQGIERWLIMEAHEGEPRRIRRAVEVHWTARVAGSGCRVDEASARVERVLFLREGQVFDPTADAWVLLGGDSDGDGVSNYAELTIP